MTNVPELDGLSEDEVEAKRLKYGTNTTLTESTSPIWVVIKEVVSEPLFVILACTALIYFAW